VTVQRPLPYEELLDVDALWMADPPEGEELRRLEGLAGAGDPEASFRIGLALVRRLTPERWDDVADPWFIAAVKRGGSAWAWLATDAYRQDPMWYRAWMARAIGLDYPRPEAPGIQIAPHTIEPVDASDWDMSPVSACFQVAETSDAVVLALGRAAPRLTRIDERGREYASDEEAMDVLYGENAPRRPDGEALFTTGWASDPLLDDPRGPYLLTNTPDHVFGPMARTMIRIVVDELVDAGVTEAHVGPYRPKEKPQPF
jgi:hypothetical protein